MNDFQADKQHLLDLLVDGELSERERGELLAWCEREPDGWRRCALAFLEAQSWSKVLGDLTHTAPQPGDEKVAVHEQLSGVAAPPTTHYPQPTTHSIRQWGTMLAMAASIALAFMFGLWTRDASKAGRIAPAGQPTMKVVNDGQQPADSESGRPEQGPTDSVRLVVGGQPGANGEVQLPVVDGREVGGDWLLMQPSAVPDDVRQALERLGHRVEQQRRVVPFHLDDGRRLFVPVDQVEVRPVENRSYQ